MTGIHNVTWVRELPERSMVTASAGSGNAGLRGGLPVQFLEFLCQKKKKRFCLTFALMILAQKAEERKGNLLMRQNEMLSSIQERPGYHRERLQ